ncbi:MAG: ABC transporter substrate-binding protein [Sphingomonas fennica]
MRRSSLLLLAVLALLAGCDPPPQPAGPIAVSLIGSDARLEPPARVDPDGAQRALLAAVAEGLLRRDAQGQIEPGLASRWDVSDDGLAYTFRIAEDAPFDAEAVARLLRAAIARRSANPLRLLFAAVEEIVAVTPEVIEIRLIAPRPDLLDLLAAPEMALIADGKGGGPFRIADRRGTTLMLSPPADDAEADEASGRPPAVRVRVERAALAIVRFAAGGAAYVGGGTFADLPVVSAADADVASLRFDPVQGLFGLRVASLRGALADPAGRLLLARAIDRARIVTTIGAPGLQPIEPSATAPPVPPAPQAVPPAPQAGPQAAPTVLTLALPAGPGATQLYRLIAADWARIGISVAQAAPGDPAADLRLVDLVAPTAAPDWRLAALACRRREPCAEAAEAALVAALRAPDRAARTAGVAEAVRLLDESGLYMPITLPVRWSLVSAQAGAWRENDRAAHPLDRLRK